MPRLVITFHRKARRGGSHKVFSYHNSQKGMPHNPLARRASGRVDRFSTISPYQIRCSLSSDPSAGLSRVVSPFPERGMFPFAGLFAAACVPAKGNSTVDVALGLAVPAVMSTLCFACRPPWGRRPFF